MDLETERSDYDLTYISLGAGVQSSALLVCSALGLYGVPRADIAIFADTGDEPYWVYEYLWKIAKWSDIPVHLVNNGCISEQTRKRDTNGTSVPFFTEGEDGRASMLMRMCTSEFKIRPIEKYLRFLLGYQKRQRVKHKVSALIGISFDEVMRIRPSRTKWIKNSWPLVDAKITRTQCLNILKDFTDLPQPKRSACVFCPYKSNREWRFLRNHAPAEFERACRYDDEIRNRTGAGRKKPIYVHRSLQPLREVDLDSELDQLDLWGNECEGMCGV